MIPTVRTSFQIKYKEKERSLVSPSCKVSKNLNDEASENGENICNNRRENTDLEEQDSSIHILYHGPPFRKFWQDKNFDDDKDLCYFYRQVIEYRIEHSGD